jgi:hypothetical protein
MSRNRKNESSVIRFAPALKAALLCAFIGGSAIGYVWQKNQIIDLGRRIKEREINLGRLRETNLKLSKQLVTLRSPAYLELRLKQLNLPLVQPSPTQILRLQEKLPDDPAPSGSALLAERHAGLPAPPR